MHLTFPVICSQCAEALVTATAGNLLTCPHCGARHLGTRVSPDAMELAHTENAVPPDEMLEVVESTPDLLRLRLKRLHRSAGTSVITIMGLSLVAVWIGLAFLIWKQILATDSSDFLINAIPVGGIGFVGSLVALYALRGNTEIELTRERLTCRRRTCLFRSERSLPIDTIESVQVVELEKASRAKSPTCVVHGRDEMLPLTPRYSGACSRRVAELVRGRLREWDQS